MGTLHTYITQQNRKPDSVFSISARFNTEKKKKKRRKVERDRGQSGIWSIAKTTKINMSPSPGQFL